MGRVKLEIRKIENPTNRQVTYSKRRNGLIKKAYELSVLCEIDIALLMFSPSGRLNHFAGKKRIEDVIARFATLSDHERSKSQCLKWCTDGANAPRKIENPELLLKAAKKLKQESYMTTTTIGGQFQRSTTLETVQYEIQRTQGQLHEMENRLRIYEGDVNCVNSIQQLENLEHHLHNALETLRLHKQAMDSSSSCAEARGQFVDPATTISSAHHPSQFMYGMQLAQQQQQQQQLAQLQQQQVTASVNAGAAGNISISSNCSSLLQNPTADNSIDNNNINNSMNNSNPHQNMIHHWLSAYSRDHAAAAAHHSNIMMTPIADHPPPGTINLSTRESPGECSSATSTLYNRALCNNSTPPDQNLHHGAALLHQQPPNSNSSPLSDQAITAAQTLSHHLGFSAARSQWTPLSSSSPYHHHRYNTDSALNTPPPPHNEHIQAGSMLQDQDSNSMICNVRDVHPIKSMVYRDNYETSLIYGMSEKARGTSAEEHREEADAGNVVQNNARADHGVMMCTAMVDGSLQGNQMNRHMNHNVAGNHSQDAMINPLSLGQAQAVMGMMLARSRQQQQQEPELEARDQQSESISIMRLSNNQMNISNHEMNTTATTTVSTNNHHLHELMSSTHPHAHLYGSSSHDMNSIGQLYQQQQQLHHHQQLQAAAARMTAEATALSTCTVNELRAGNSSMTGHMDHDARHYILNQQRVRNAGDGINADHEGHDEEEEEEEDDDDDDDDDEDKDTVGDGDGDGNEDDGMNMARAPRANNDGTAEISQSSKRHHQYLHHVNQQQQQHHRADHRGDNIHGRDLSLASNHTDLVDG